MTQSMKVIFYGLLVASLLTGCGQGKRIKTGEHDKNAANRLIVTNSDALEALVALDATKNIVGTHDMGSKSFLDESLKWPSIGNWQNPNIEAIIDLKPDIVVAYQKWPDPVGFDDKLKPFNISVERINFYYMSEYSSDIYRLASIIGKENRADTIVNDFNRIVGIIKNAVNDIDVKKKVYLELYAPFSAVGTGTGGNEILELVNATNIAAKLNITSPKVSTEWLLEENPDIIIKVVSSNTITVDIYEQLVNRTGWDKLDAVKNGRIYLISSELMYGPRAMIGSLYIGKWCYPERFVSIDPDSVLAYWMKKYYGVSSDNFIFTLKK